MIGIDMNFMINLPYLSQETTPRKRVFRRVLSGERGLIYLEMMFLSYGRLILTSCLISLSSHKRLQENEFFEESFLEKEV